MLNLSDDDLFFRLTNTEDSLVERKTSGDSRDWLKTVVAFANSVPIAAPGVLFIGVKDDGTPEDQPVNLDSLQKTLGEKLARAYPVIPYATRILSKDGKQFLCVIVWGSQDRPHFAGPAFVREGSVTRLASKEQFDGLIAQRSAKTYEIFKWKGKAISVDFMNVEHIRIQGPVASSMEAIITDCTQFYVTLEGRGYKNSVPLGRVDVSFDHVKERLRLEVRPI